ncbi:NAD(P)-dependent oxidoreductase [Phytohabitans aurantiacus]|uniref:6-phosphogluconate dehydrogenase n=1 Tax=Phytohabitans aurantiacus TaxID=3016789 RepID=A0ABQ5RB27_9ACTN|nr:NAD(P)-binding domain-containing protein [Phytohabitans aurantiacus]GLI03947.1 6-phosphogluconate dehydrogenase [Phytohabitans aurantiacus]
MNKQPVTVIGLGPMGRAMVGAFLDNGHAVTVWNRTESKADDLVARGAVRADTIQAALAANELVVLSLTDYAAVYDVLGSATTALAGRVLVNLSSDTPDQARTAARWAAEHGATQVTGGVLVPPPGIGKPGSSTFYSGPREAFEAHRETLEVLTATDYRGDDPGLAALYYQLNMDMFWTSMLGWLHALALARANGISAKEMLPYAKLALNLEYFLEFYTDRIDAGEHPGDVDRLAMGMASVEHVAHTTRDSRVDPALPDALLEIFRRGQTAGHGDDSFTSLIDIVTAQR